MFILFDQISLHALINARCVLYKLLILNDILISSQSSGVHVRVQKGDRGS